MTRLRIAGVFGGGGPQRRRLRSKADAEYNLQETVADVVAYKKGG